MLIKILGSYILQQGWIYWGCRGVHTPPSPGQVGCKRVQFFMIKQKNIRDIMINEIHIIHYSNLF